MTRITLDAVLSSRLDGLDQAAELCDPAGRVLGHFIPRIDLSGWEPISPEVSDEELDRREAETESYSTAEVLAHLEKLKCSGSDGNAPR